MAKSKYGNRSITVGGHRFDSQAEARRYLVLRSMLEAGQIADLELQPKFELIPAFPHNGKKQRAITYIADFRYIDKKLGLDVVEDVKGVRTQAFAIKAKLMMYFYPEIDFRVVQS